MTLKTLFFSVLLGLGCLVRAENLLTPECSGFEKEPFPQNIKLLWGKGDKSMLTTEDSYRGKKSLKVTFNDKLLRVFIHTPEQTFKKGYYISCIIKYVLKNPEEGLYVQRMGRLYFW